MLFSVLPAHTEAIGWIQGRVDLVSSTLLLLALLALFRSQGSVGPTCWHWSALAGLIFLGALLAKESVVALPLAWTVWEISAIRRGDSNRRGAGVVSRFLSLFLAGLVYWTLRVRAVGALVSFPLSLSAIGLRALALLSVLGEYGRILLFPDLTLNFYSGIRVAATPTVLAISLVVALVVGSALAAAWRWAPEFLPWVAWVPIMLSPPLLFILYEPAPEVGFYTAERFLYLPSVGWCVLLGSLVARFLEAQAKARRSRLGLMTFGAVLAGYAGLTLLRLLPWADPVDLYLAMKAQPNLSAAVRILAHNNLGRVYLERGDFTPARTEFQAALRLNPDSAFAYNNMGVLLIREGNPIEARQWLEKAIHLDPTYGDSFGNLGAAYEATGDLPAARRAYEAGVRAAPNSTWLAKGLARVSAEDAFHRGLKVGVSR
jgi:tetratricopeptide (TPR) repeat protein